MSVFLKVHQFSLKSVISLLEEVICEKSFFYCPVIYNFILLSSSIFIETFLKFAFLKMIFML